MKKSLPIIMLSLVLILSACSKGNQNAQNQATVASQGNMSSGEMASAQMNSGEMNHSDSEELPKGMINAQNPKFPVGSHALIQADHMPGMNGADATIVGAYDTMVYAVSYEPVTGGDKVSNHKWVVQEDIKDAGDQPLSIGDKVTLSANHMEGMKGAKATIDSAEKTIAYMVDYTPTTGGEPVKNHKWLIESELSAK
ncbi:YdhK family protein [Paenibacillus pinistramenti]|uniref:YdhK family protein n=1 Tax=Paenibacillus pinistramenti TaxID=1768003 RepID=UPI00110962A6|nr:YdhK family protein [Paenibacillus pinistramenti]